jgi:hypothetical protein
MVFPSRDSFTTEYISRILGEYIQAGALSYLSCILFCACMCGLTMWALKLSNEHSVAQLTLKAGQFHGEAKPLYAHINPPINLLL